MQYLENRKTACSSEIEKHALSIHKRIVHASPANLDSACGSVFAYICQTAHITLRAPRHADGAAVQDETVA